MKLFYDTETIVLKIEAKRIINAFRNSDKMQGEIGDKEFKIRWFKRYDPFAFNVTVMKGIIKQEGDSTELFIHYSVWWLYKLAIPILVALFSAFEVAVIDSNQFDIQALEILAFIEVVAVVSGYAFTKWAFERDKRIYRDFVHTIV